MSETPESSSEQKQVSIYDITCTAENKELGLQVVMVLVRLAQSRGVWSLRESAKMFEALTSLVGSEGAAAATGAVPPTQSGESKGEDSGETKGE